MTKPEAQFITSVNNYIIKTPVHVEGMSNPYRRGTPDNWYDGDKGDLWVEYKFVRAPPPYIEVMLSHHQLNWLKRAYNNGRNVAVIIGCPKGGVVLRNLRWAKAIPREDFNRCLLERKQLAAWIKSQVLTSAKPFELPVV